MTSEKGPVADIPRFAERHRETLAEYAESNKATAWIARTLIEHREPREDKA